MTKKKTALKSLAKGSSFLLASTTIGMLLQLVSGVLVIRAVEKSDYGLYSLAIVVVGMLSSMSLIGFTNGVTQLLSSDKTKKDTCHSWSVIYTAIIIVVFVSAVAGFSLYLCAGILADSFDKPGLQPIFEFTSYMITPVALIRVIISIFRGFSISLPKAIFQDLGTRVIRIAGVLMVLFVSGGLWGVLWASLVATYITTIMISLYAVKKLPVLLEKAEWQWVGGEIVTFSFPLFGASIVIILLTASSTLLLGYFSQAQEVAIYSAPRPFTKVLELPLLALSFIYLPIATALYKSDGLEAIKGLYCSATKWIALISIPVFLLFFMDSSFLIVLLFGEEYQTSSTVLSVLALGSFSHVIFGPNGMMLITFDKRKDVFFSTVLAAIINISLGILLIPDMGALGAAIATACALFISNTVISYNLYRSTKILPMIKQDAFLLIGILSIGSLLYWVGGVLHLDAIIWHILTFMIVCLMCVMGPVLMKTLTTDDVLLLVALERKLLKSDAFTRRLAKRCGLNDGF
ncbi:MAG: flippase [Methylococcales bacterium]